ncbi:BnaA02g19200D [Brassica napus]|uniref:Sulfurtransferase n=1 Tax=Brassica napus TaxID=3708 RepID=A0A078GK22_BRANA|nr:BnaA02g19200D [Brassica napus]
MASTGVDEPVVSVDCLHSNLRNPDLKVTSLCFGCVWYMPDEQRNPIQEYQVAHIIPGPLFFDLDRTTSLSHMLPSEGAFAAGSRVWWMLRVFGHEKVWVLDGGLPRWRASGYDVESSASGNAILKASAASEAIEKIYEGQSVSQPRATFKMKFQPHLVWTLDQVKNNMEDQTHQNIDARSKARFDANVFLFLRCLILLLTHSYQQKTLKKRFEQEEPPLDKPIMASCGTGVTACILALGLHRLGETEVPVYDGSWTEWATEPDLPIEGEVV